MKNIPLYEVRPISTLKDMLESSARLYADKAAFLVKTEEGGSYKPITFEQYLNDVNALGTALISLGLSGKRVAIISENRYEWTVAYLAVVNGTGVVVPLDKDLPAAEIKNLLLRSKADAVFYSGAKKNEVETIASELPNLQYLISLDDTQSNGRIVSYKSLMEKGFELVNGGDRRFIDAKVDREGMSILLFTSGTTDKAKAVMLSHKNVCSNLMDMCSMLYIDHNDVFLLILPLHHTYACTCGFLCQIYRGSTIAFCEGLRHIVKNLKESKTTVLLAVPLILESMYKRIWDHAAKDPKLLRKLKLGLKISKILKSIGIDIRKKLFKPIHDNFGGSLRLFISGGAAIDPKVVQGFQDFGIHCVQGYGLTECSPIIALNRDVDYRNNAAGLPLPNVRVKIHNPNEEGIGEIVAKGPNIMLGYYEDEKLTKETIVDGWFHTGDLGYIDEDGFLYITGRKKNVIVTKNGKNIYPEEIETLLNRSPFIAECVVYGRESDSDGDIEVAAEIYPDMEKVKEELGTENPDEEQVRKLIEEEVHKVNRTLVLYKYVRHITIRDTEFEKTTSKKIKRKYDSKK
ncbi:long-chain-fatty-acid--CoA ligase FadD [Thermoclostridium stercorarium subsp. stercorarium DSM 8532]|jgi:long-chain acyl-CoA synthetase|uniref:Long-chain-fatty-acid--CoA ligase FadD n=3 Tax=Thermoclostridium stercorarium TaxID=1510 RepID=L7VR59_THES1|nr:AMP-binding protein [Thermoclostridium stercorarium]AGC68068.1 long-chain-fatty-acid--CoA ligase FadD [Thermoclostridium stercorarium subsp. stercorarium DSM 8532]AGI39096.1 acyl-CoA synthetase [Thermoclostridium stercorarium subsp. stercorarium DSM 8532]ANW98456.1 AMP-dependent synthetase [Thermoclostridium stercorarium subsp. thermolacticum DSM 2910]ANX00988.1 AMP-dependent synthetase [Thermoclostridium stercorarium subsp. leptospartum DSM 9219]